MKTRLTRLFSRLSLGTLGLMIASCSLPPAEAWRYIKKDGLIPYIAMEMKHEASSTGPRSRFMGQPASGAALVAAPVNDAKMVPTTAVAPLAPPPTPVLVNRGAATATTERSFQSSRPIKPQARSAAEALATAPKVTPKTEISSAPKPAPKVNTAPVVSAPPAAPKPEPKKEVATKPAAPAPAPVKPAPAAVAPVKPTAPAPSKVATTTSATAPSGKIDELPYGSPVAGRPGLVNSPYAGKMQLVDVTGLKPGQEVKCPYSGKLFRVPPGATATAKQASDAPDKK